MNSSEYPPTLGSAGGHPVHPCFPKAVSSLSIMLMFTVSPFHLFIFIVLFKQYELPQRHKFFLSLTMYDNLQIIYNGLFGLASAVFGLRTDSLSCQVLRQMCEFVLVSTFVGAGLSIAALSAERYINCFYCLRAYQIITNKRVKVVIFSIAVLSFIGGCMALHPYTVNPHPRVLSNTAMPTITITVATFLSSLIVTVCQWHLYFLSREKWRVDASMPKFGRDAEAVDLKRQQIKVTITASVVVVSYVICMIPASCYNLYILFEGDKGSFTLTWRVFSILALLNTLADPLVYGIGMADTRMLLRAAVRKLKLALIRVFINDIWTDW